MAFTMSLPRRIAIHQNFGLSVNRRDDFGKRTQSCRRTIQLPSTVIRNDDRGGALMDRASGVVARQHALDEDWAGPYFSQPAKIFPGDERLGQSRGHIH